MKNLATKNTNDFTITESGDAFISQTAVSKLCGVGQDAISKHIVKTGHILNINSINQLGFQSLELVIGHYAFDSQRTNDVALNSYRTLAKAGAKAYIYHKAGYEMKAEKIVPPTALELAKQNVALLEELEIKDNYIIASNKASIEAGDILVEEFCKSSNIIDIGRNRMFDWLHEQGYLFKGSNQPIQSYVERGFFRWLPSEEKYGGKYRYTLYITARGKIWLADKYMRFLDNT